MRHLGDVDIAPDQAREALARTVMIKLNGGLGTSMGMDRAKSLLPVRDGASFLDVVAGQVRAARAAHGVELPLILMDSLRTSADSVAALGAHAGLEVEGLPLDLLQNQEPKPHPYFHCNTLWFDLRVLRQALEERGGVLGLPLIRSSKTVDPTDSGSPRVVQIEAAMGAAIEVFDGARAIAVSRSRFLPVKTTDDLLLLRSDVYQQAADGTLGRAVDPAPLVSQDPCFYRTMANFEARFPAGPPSLRAATSLSVAGGAVEALAHQVDVAHVPRVLLDQVCIDPPQVDRFPVALAWQGGVEVADRRRTFAGGDHLCVVAREVIEGLRWVDSGEVAVAVECAVHGREGLPGNDGAEPVALDLSQVAHESKEREVGRRDGRRAQLLRGQAAQLDGQRVPVHLQPVVQRLHLAGHHGGTGSVVLGHRGSAGFGWSAHSRTQPRSPVSARITSPKEWPPSDREPAWLRAGGRVSLACRHARPSERRHCPRSDRRVARGDG